jgi:hypothetical protein
MGFSGDDWRNPCSRREPCDRRCSFPSLAIGRSHTIPDFGSTRPDSLPSFLSSTLRSFSSTRLQPSDTRSQPGRRLRSRNQLPRSQSSLHSSMLEVDGATVPPLLPANASDTRRRRSQLWRLSRRAFSSRSLHCRAGRPDRGRRKSGPTWSESQVAD